MECLKPIVLQCFLSPTPLMNWATAEGGGETYRAILGGGKRERVPRPKPVSEASESEIFLVCARSL